MPLISSKTPGGIDFKVSSNDFETNIYKELTTHKNKSGLNDGKRLESSLNRELNLYGIDEYIATKSTNLGFISSKPKHKGHKLIDVDDPSSFDVKTSNKHSTLLPHEIRRNKEILIRKKDHHQRLRMRHKPSNGFYSNYVKNKIRHRKTNSVPPKQHKLPENTSKIKKNRDFSCQESLNPDSSSKPNQELPNFDEEENNIMYGKNPVFSNNYLSKLNTHNREEPVFPYLKQKILKSKNLCPEFQQKISAGTKPEGLKLLKTPTGAYQNIKLSKSFYEKLGGPISPKSPQKTKHVGPAQNIFQNHHLHNTINLQNSFENIKEKLLKKSSRNLTESNTTNSYVPSSRRRFKVLNKYS
ncbi:unnamed protein product [Moneuplotes crassus]|uniref:Uncharacterized protein n=1 Tax=Euplotes crassus TaxID=5936 RepID=A0AAD1UD45_EUPCR|nr:unnamed protein product [Moneuplotes crassus]